jgi:hypothetical protein
MLTVLESSSAQARISAAAEFLTRFPPVTEVIIVGATRSAADDFVRQYSISHRATFGLHRFSFLQLVARVVSPELARSNLAPSTALGEHAVAARAVFEAQTKGVLHRLSTVADRPGFARAVARTMREIRLGQINTEELRNSGPEGTELAQFANKYLVSCPGNT